MVHLHQVYIYIIVVVLQVLFETTVVVWILVVTRLLLMTVTSVHLTEVITIQSLTEVMDQANDMPLEVPSHVSI